MDTESVGHLGDGSVAEPSKVAIVAGAGPGLGLALARRFGQLGYRVGLIARRPDALRAYVAELEAEGIVAAAAVADLSQEQQVADSFGSLRESLGSPEVLVFSPVPDLQGAICKPSQVTARRARALLEGQPLAAV